MPKMARRTVLKNGLGLMSLAVAGRPAIAAASFPDHQITVVCPFAPGGINDLCARVVARGLEQAFKQTAVVENKPGASSILGMAAIARSAPDGHNLVTCSDRIVCFPTIGATPFDIEKDFAPVTRLVVVPMFLVTRRGLGVKTIDELIALAKSNPNLTFASTGSGSTTHLTGSLFKARAGVNLVHVPYKGSIPAINDVVAGHVDVMFADLGGVAPFIDSGYVNAIAVASAKRSMRFPNISTFAEQGMADFEASLWIGLLARGGTPPETIAKINKVVRDTFADTELAKPIFNLGAEVATDTSENFIRLIDTERARMAPILRAENIHL